MVVALLVAVVIIFWLWMYVMDLRWWVKYLRRERDREADFAKALLEKFTGVIDIDD